MFTIATAGAGNEWFLIIMLRCKLLIVITIVAQNTTIAYSKKASTTRRFSVDKNTQLDSGWVWATIWTSI